MGYDIHITRKQDWSEGNNNHISLDEWQNYITSQNDFYEEDSNADLLKIFVWKHSLGLTPFIYSEGNISIKNPNDKELQKALEIAQFLNAEVQGDDGEIYSLAHQQQKKPWWKFW
jgi:hypothetical protein